jgi:hypothetical protein
LRDHHTSITAIFIEASRCELRLPAGVTLPPLTAPPPAPASPPKAPVASTNGHAVEPAVQPVGQRGDGGGRLPTEARISPDDARVLKQLAQQAYGYEESARRLRHDLGFEPDEKLTLRHLAAHVPVAQYEQLRATYEARLQVAVAADGP